MTVQDTTAPARRKRPTEPEVYDFRRPMTLAREHSRALEVAFETFTRQWGTLLTSRLRVVAQATFESVELRTYDEYVRALPDTTAMVLCSVEQGRQTAVMQLPVETLMVWVDYLLGGPGTGVAEEDRELTEIEWHLVRDLLQQALADLTYAFASISPIDVTARSVQYNPQFVQAAAASEPVVIATFELSVADRTAPATLMVPADVMLAALQSAEHNDSRTPEELREHQRMLDRISAQVNEVPVDVSVRFAEHTVTPRDVSRLAVGDVVPIRHRVDKPLDVVVDGVVLARAAIGSNGSRLACLVVTSEETN